MGLLSIERSTGPTVRSDELSTRRELIDVFVRRKSPRVIALSIVGLALARLLLGGGAGRADLIAVAVTVAITGTVEWVIHKYLLHAPLDSWTTRTLGTGVGHHRHHLDPTDVDWLLLRGVDAAKYVPVFGAVTAAWSLPVMWITGSSMLAGFLTSWLFAAVSLMHYEWVHLMVHSRYRPRTRFYRTLARHHRLHHYRNEHYWLGVTSNTGDRLLRTLPAHKTNVPLLSRAEAADRGVADRAR